MTSPALSVFALPDTRAAKAAPELIAADDAHFAAVSTALAESVASVSAQLDTALRAPGGEGQAAMDRDLDVRRLEARLRALRRLGLDLVLGRMDHADGSAPRYVGRLGLADSAGRRLLVDWRTPAAEPFFAATRAQSMGLANRRRYRWSGDRVLDYWDEVLSADVGDLALAPDEESALLASLGEHRSSRMRDVLSTLQADQDAVIRASSRGALVVDGGPGTGKTVVALHRAAYLLHADPRLADGRGGVLVVGPHQPYLAYVADVLPNLGEEGARTCTWRDLVPDGASAGEEADPEVAGLKASVEMVGAIEPAVALYEEPPADGMEVATPWAEVWVSPDDWVEAFSSPDPGSAHNDARDDVWEALLAILVDKHAADDEDVTDEMARAELGRDEGLREAFARAWPLIDPADLVGDLWTVPAYLRRCAPWLSREEVALLQREEAQAWTVSDLPLLDAARRRLGDPAAARRRRRQRAAVAAAREEMARVVDDLVASDDSEMLVMSMLRGEDLRGALVPDPAMATGPADALAGPFAHIVVDEAQELTDAEWQVLLARCPSRSLTIVGDRAQARHGFAESWEDRLRRVGVEHIRVASLTVNYRTPTEVMDVAEPVIRAAVPDANVPTSIRSAGLPVRRGRVEDLDAVVDAWVAANPEGVACVVGAPGFGERPRVRSLRPELVKGLEFDLVVLVDPEGWGTSVEGAVDRYVAMTRSTRELVLLSRS